MSFSPHTRSSSSRSHSSDSRSSVRSSDSLSDETRTSPALILVDENNSTNTEERCLTLNYRSDDDDESVAEVEISQPEIVLSPSVIFLYCLSPVLKLGAMLTLSNQAQLKVSLPALLVFSLLSVLSRQIWFLLARYIRSTDVGDIVVEAFARGQRKGGLRSFLGPLSRFGSGSMHVLLSAVYLKAAVHTLEIYVPKPIPSTISLLVLSVIFVVFVASLSVGASLASKRLVHSTAIANLLYVVWLISVLYAHAKGTLNTDDLMFAQGQLFQDIPAVAFIFASSFTLRLYSGALVLRGASSSKSMKRHLSISSMSFMAALVGTALILPLMLPSVKSHGDTEQTDETLQLVISILTAFILVLAIPPLIITSYPLYIPPSLVQPVQRIRLPFLRSPISSADLDTARRALSMYALLILLFLFSLLPKRLEPALEDIVLLLALLDTYSLPALLHIILHNLRRPRSILVSQTPRTPIEQPLLRSHTGSGGSFSDSEEDIQVLTSASAATAAGGGILPGADPETTELLLRKERALQRRRFMRRILWDLGVWTLLLPVGGGGFIWAIGRLAHVW